MRGYGVVIVALGYVGMPLAVEFCRVGFQVIGIDTDEEKLVYPSKGNP